MAVMILSSAKLCKSEFLMHRKKSLRNILRKIRPFGTPGKIFWNALKMLLLLTLYFLSFKYEFRKVTVLKLSSEAWSLAMSTSFEI